MGKLLFIALVLMLVAGDNGRGDELLPAPANPARPLASPRQIEPPPSTAVPADAPRVEASWQTALMQHIKQYAHYPIGAQLRAEEGQVVLSFTVDRSGHVLSREIVRSSGYPELDNEAISMIERAQPLPPFPASVPQAELDLTLPLCFLLHDFSCAAPVSELRFPIPEKGNKGKQRSCGSGYRT